MDVRADILLRVVAVNDPDFVYKYDKESVDINRSKKASESEGVP